MNALVISEDTLSSQLAECEDGEEGSFTVKGTLHLVPGVGAVVSFEDITKKGYKAEKKEDDDDDKPAKKKMSAAAAAVVGRKTKEDY